MSARSRYLQAISPRGDDIPLTPSPNSHSSPSASHNSFATKEGVVCGSGGGNTNVNNSNSNNAYNVNLKSPSEIRGRKVLVGGGGGGGGVGAIGIDPIVSNNNFVRSSPPPPPPPGPPPKKAAKKHQHQQQYPRGTGSSSGFGSVKPPENIIFNNPGDKSSAADKNEQGEEETVAKGGSPWSPQEEIQGGSVAKFQQMLWGGGGGTGGAVAVGGAGGVLGGGKGAGGGGAMLLPATPPRHTPGSSSSFPVSRVDSGNPTKNFVNNRIATSTTPKSTKGNTSNSSNNATMTGPSPRYKRNAPPPLENNDRDDETSGLPAQRPTTTTATTTMTTTATTSTSSTPPTSIRKTPKIQLPTPPSRILSSPLRSGSVKNTPIAGEGAGGGGPSNSSSSSALRHRVGNILNLTPLDTSFGRSGDEGNAGGIQSSPLSPSPLLPPNASSTTSGRKLYAANEKGDNSTDTGHYAAAASLSYSPGFKGNNVGGGDSGNVDGGKGDAHVTGSSRTNLSPKYRHPRGDKGTTAIADDSNVKTHDDEDSSPPPPVAAGINNDDGISTFTAFKRPNVKVGLVFTRRSAQHPDVAVISRIMPESIFRRHHLPSPSGGGGGVTTLEGVEVIAVNGTPVRDPRHAAELVARAVEEVRLTVKRGVCTGGSGLPHHDSLAGTNPCGGDGSGNATTEGEAVENVSYDNPGKESDPRERMARTLALIDASSLSQRAKSMGREESKLSVRMEEGGEDLSALERRDEKCDSNIVFTEKKKEGEEEEEWSAWTERRDADHGREADLTAVNASKLAVSSRGVGGGRTSSVMSMSTTTTMPKSAEIAERRRKVAQAMLLSEELVEDSITGGNEDNVLINKEYNDGNECDGWKRNEIMESAASNSRRLSTDPIQLNRSNDDDEVEETFTSSGGDGNGSSRARSTAGFSTASSPSTALSVAASTALSGVSGTPSNVSSASAADRRRRAALEMYHSSEMVPDNVDDVRLGTIDAFGPPLTPKDNATHALDNDKVSTLSSWMKAKPLSDVGRVTSFGSATSKARTDVTTSSVATARMGGGGIRLNLSPIVGRGSGGRSPSSSTISSGVVALASAAHANNTATCSTASSPLDGFNSGSIGDTQGGSPTNAPMRIESPAAQRRRERAAHRRLIGAGDRGGDSPLGDGTQKMGVGDWPKIPVSASPVAKVTASNSIQTPPPIAPQNTPTSADIAQRRLKVAQAMIHSDDLVNDHVGGTPDPFELSKSSEECITVASGAKSGVGSNGSPGSPRSNRSAMGFSKIKSGSRLRGGQLTTGDGQKTSYSQVQEDVPKKKKSSIFGVARLIRKASSKKSKSSNKSASLVEDTNLFEVGDSPIAVSTRCASPMSNTSPSKAAATAIEEKRESDTLPAPPSLIASDPFSNLTPAMHGNDGWEGSDFFKENPFAPSPFESDLASGDNEGNDAFGFPTKAISDGVAGNRPSMKVPLDADRVASNTFFDLDVNVANTWGDPNLILPVNITPRRDNAAHRFNDDQHGNVDANSYDESEMSEVTDPTFASSSIKQNTAVTARLEANGGDTSRKDENSKTKGKNIVDNSDSSIKENHSRQSRQNRSSVSASRAIEKRRAVNGDVNVDPPLASLDTIESSEHEREDNNTPITILPVAKSRILSKYAKSGKVRRGAVHSSLVGNDKIEPQSSDRSIGSVGSISQNSRTGKLQQELEISAKISKTPISADPKPARKGGATATSAAASAIALAAVPSMNGGALPHQQIINPAATSSLYRSRKSPKRLSTSSTAGNTSPVKSSSSPARSPAKKYSSPNRKKKVSPSVVENPGYYSMESRLGQIKDPIQRAGVKLLWAAAIPIQTQARRFIARQVAIRRMCAVLTVQAFVRRWLAERDLEIAIWSAIQIQASFRGWFARDSLEDNHYCATQIQRVARGYLATMHVFEDLYSITVVQSVVRMHLAINCAVDRLSSIIAIQSWWRGIRTRELIEKMDYSAVAIQTQWRRYLAQMSYQFDIIDIIIVQSVARRWNDRRTLATMRLQRFARVVIAKKKFQDKKAMHALFTRHISATKIQALWRRYTAQVDMLVYIVNVILIQSLWRRRNAVRLYKPLLNRMKLSRERKRQNSAISIQSAWRGFVVYSTYLIKRYENKAASTIQATWRGYWQATNYSVLYCAIIKVQALVRGAQERSWLVFQNKCATIIQASSRRLLVRKDNHTECMVSILIAAAASSLRMRNAARRLQFWWMDEMWKRKEKHAALVIERFFIYIKKEVEKEVAALKKKKKERRKRHKMKQSDDYILERAWLGVADDAVVPVVQTALLSQRTAASHHPSVNNGTGDKLHNKYSRFRARGAIQSFEDDVQSDVSGLTDLDFGYRNSGTRSRQKKG